MVIVQEYGTAPNLKYAAGFGDPFKTTFDAIEYYTTEQLRLEPTLSPRQRDWIADPNRAYVLGEREFTPGHRRVKVDIEEVTNQIYVVNPYVIDRATCIYAPERLGTFEQAANCVHDLGGTILQATQPPTDEEAEVVLDILAGHGPLKCRCAPSVKPWDSLDVQDVRCR